MKEKVTEFLGDLPKSASDQFNKALELYRKSKNSNDGQVRFLNSQGYSADRLKILLYDLQKLYNITDIEVAKARRSLQAPKEETQETKVVNLAAFIQEVLDFDLENASEEEISGATEEILLVVCSGKIPEEKPIGVDEKVFIESFQTALNEAEDKEEFIKVMKEHFQSMETPDTDPANPELIVNEDKIVDLPENPSAEDVVQAIENAAAVDPKIDVSDIDVVDPKEETNATAPPVDEEETKKAVEAEKDEFRQMLADFDVEAESYNDLKSFAAVLSDYSNKDPKDQKKETLKAFVLEAKKNF